MPRNAEWPDLGIGSDRADGGHRLGDSTLGRRMLTQTRSLAASVVARHEDRTRSLVLRRRGSEVELRNLVGRTRSPGENRE